MQKSNHFQARSSVRWKEHSDQPEVTTATSDFSLLFVTSYFGREDIPQMCMYFTGARALTNTHSALNLLVFPQARLTLHPIFAKNGRSLWAIITPLLSCRT
jgi:hypothetical protein